MPIQSVAHIADVSFKDHFFGAEGDGPVNGKITVNHNTFDVSFGDDGKVTARFSSGNALTNAFRGKTLSRFVRTLQTQYDGWLDEQRKIEEAKAEELRITGGYKDNPNAGTVAEKVAALREKILADKPAGHEKFVSRLDDIEMLAGLRNSLTRVEKGTDCDRMVRECGKERGKGGFLTHFDDNTKGLDERAKKGYVLNMLDTIIDGFLAAADLIEQGKSTALDFLKAFDGACVEAKNDNVQEFLARAAGIVKAAKSDETTDLAKSAIAEFNDIAEEVRRPFYEEAKASCEAGVREFCAKKGITDEDEIRRRIDSKAANIVLEKDDEINPLIRKALEEKGRFALYGALAGAKRPLTQIAKDEKTGKWTVTTVVDKSTGEPVLKPVSAFDIDRNFSKMVDLFLDDAVAMGEVANVVRTVEPGEISFASREDLRADGVLAKAAEFSAPEKLGELAKLVKAGLAFELDEAEAAEFDAKLAQALDDVLMIRDADDPAGTPKRFKAFASNYATNGYFDETDDLSRLVHLVKSRVETLVSPEKKALSDLDGKIDRCTQMLCNAFPDHRIDVDRVKTYLERTLKPIVKTAFRTDIDKRNAMYKYCSNAYGYLFKNGTLFTDRLGADMGHRAAGRAEVVQHELFKVLMQCIERYNNAPPGWYMFKING